MTLEQAHTSFKNSTLYQFVEDRLDKNRDAKIIVTARNSETGTGKTTLAILLAKMWDRNGWSEEKLFMDIEKYLAYYNLKAKAGDVLIFDDAQAGADSRRSTSKENVFISKYWTLNRTKNVVSILTLPTQRMLDNRLLELSDIRLNVIERGVAYPYRVYVDDVKRYVRTYRLKHPELDLKEVIRFSKFHGKEYLEAEKKKKAFIESQFEKDYEESMEEAL